MRRQMWALAVCAAVGLPGQAATAQDTTRLDDFWQHCDDGLQKKAIDEAVRLRDLDESDPVPHFLIGIVAGSVGAKRRSLALESFRKFLDLTGGKRSDAEWPDDTEEEFARLCNTVGLEDAAKPLRALRDQVRAWVKELKQKRELLVAPHPKQLAKLVKRLNQRREHVVGEIEELNQKLRDQRSLLATLEEEYESLRKRKRNDRRFDLRAAAQRKIDQIKTTKEAIDKLENQLGDEEDELAGIDAQLEPAKERLGE